MGHVYAHIYRLVDSAVNGYAVQRQQRANADSVSSGIHDPQCEARATETRNVGNDGGIVVFPPRYDTECVRLLRVLMISYRNRLV